MYATYRAVAVVAFLGACSAFLVAGNSWADKRERKKLRDDINSLQYEANQLNKHRHFIDANGTTSGTPIIRADGSYLSGAWF